MTSDVPAAAPQFDRPVPPEFHHGLVVGRFFPPHRGHAFLVRSAAQFCGRVTVGVFDRPSRALPLELRAAALREAAAPFGNVTVVHEIDAVPIDYDSPEIWERHVEIFRRGVVRARAGIPVDVVFTSESYGDELARRLGCRHAQVDVRRSWASISGTAIRREMTTHWDWMLPAVRSRLARRVIVLGAESTGTTTLAADLALAWGTAALVPEFGREYTMQKLAARRARDAAATLEGLSWTTPEFAHIAVMQTHFEREAARHGGPLLVCDTDALATQVWHGRYCGGTSEAVEAAIRQLDPFRLYLLTHHDGVPFEDDGLRDGRHLRARMSADFEGALRARGARYQVVTGSREERLHAALGAARAFMAEPWIL